MDTNVIKVASTINCKSGSVRSLALNTKSVLKNNDLGGNDPSKIAWDFAKDVKNEFGNHFTQKNARDHFAVVFPMSKKSMNHKSDQVEKPVVNTNNTNPKGGTVEFGREAKTILKNEKFYKNEKIRRLLALGHGISQIAKAMGLGYQRVKNVMKKSVNKNCA